MFPIAGKMIEPFINLIIILIQAIGSIHRLVLMVIHWKKKPNIPPIKNPLLKLSATTLASKIRNGEVRHLLEMISF